MKYFGLGLAALALGATTAHAGGIDRSGQSNGILFEPGRVMQLSFGSVTPDVGGTDVLGNKIGNVGANFLQLGFAYKADLNDKLSYAFILDTPFAADVKYPGSSAGTMLGGTVAKANATALTGLLRYKFNDRVSVFGGLRAQQSSAHIDLRGLAYGGFNGYSVDLGTNTAVGYQIGAAYEIPDIHLRIALSYNSAISHNFGTLETISGSPVGVAPTKVQTPQSVNIDFQSGVAKDTLVFG